MCRNAGHKHGLKRMCRNAGHKCWLDLGNAGHKYELKRMCRNAGHKHELKKMFEKCWTQA